MTREILSDFENLPPEQQNQLDQRCDEFEAAIQSGEKVSIEDFVEPIQDETARRIALNEFICLELYHRRSVNDETSLAEYRSRFPEYGEIVTAAFAEKSSLLAPSAELGSFLIERQLGFGGMGIVYAAHDQKLDRQVALKVLPYAFAQDEQRLKRFQREAKILANLTHPHIATLYGFEELEGFYLCVMEYVPGQTLAQVLEETDRIPIEDIDRIFVQISAALEYAHARGIVHRDLKPSNILITPGGDAKVLDFGLATNVLPTTDRESTDLTDLTDAEALNMAGTVPYMSPEQLRGRPVDKRIDIWAFGCCLFEALTSKRAFRGESLADVVSAILDKSPDWNSLPAETPQGMRFVLKRSLEKDPERRLRDIGDAWLSEDALQDLREFDVIPATKEFQTKHRSAVEVSLDNKHPSGFFRSWFNVIPWLLLALMSIGLIFAWPRSRDAPSPSTLQYELTLSPNQHLALDEYGPLGEPRHSIALSPNGALLAYIAVDSEASIGTPQIFIKRLNSFDSPVRIEHTEGAYHLFFSPDSRRLGFFAGGKLKHVTIPGNSLVELCEVSFPIGGTWSDDGNIYIGDFFGDRLVIINENGGQSSTIKSKWRDKDFQWIDALPDGRGLLSSQRGAGLTWIDTNSRKHVLLPLDIDVHPCYAAGHLLFAVDGRLMASPFDIVRPEIQNDPVPVLDGVRTGQWGVGQYSVSHNGTLAYVPGISGRKSKLVRISKSQITNSGGDKIVAEPLIFPTENFGMFTLSPDDQSLAVEVHKGTIDIWRYDLQTGNRTRITFQGNNRQPIWSPDGKSIVFSSDRDGNMNLFHKSAFNESADAVRLTPKSPKVEYVFSWGENDEIGYREMSDEGHTLKALQLSEGGAVSIRPMKNITYTSHGRFSPDSQWLVYTHWQAGDRASVQLQRYPGSGDNWAVSGAEGGEEPVWSRAGDKIYYRIDATWMSVDFPKPATSGNAPQLPPPQRLFSGNYINVSGMSYDVTSGGDFILLQSLQDPKPNRIRVVHHWLKTLPKMKQQD